MTPRGQVTFDGVGECGQYEFRYFSYKLNRFWGASNAIMAQGNCNAAPAALFVRGLIHGIQVSTFLVVVVLTIYLLFMCVTPHYSFSCFFTVKFLVGSSVERNFPLPQWLVRCI